MNSKVLMIIILVILVLGYFYVSSLPSQQPTPTPQPTQPTQQTNVKGVQIGPRVKSSNCQINGPLQDKDCTPGAIDPSLTKDVICNSTFTTKSVRNVPSAEKRQVYEEYSITSHQPGQYEVDHLISLELGGSNDIANLWPEPAEPRPGFHEKDAVENYLHKQICNDSISLANAQQEISSNWLQIYQSAPNIINNGM